MNEPALPARRGQLWGSGAVRRRFPKVGLLVEATFAESKIFM